MNITYEIKTNDIGKSLKEILKNKLYISTRLLAKLKINKCILVNENIEPVTYVLKENDKILVKIPDFSTCHFLDKFKRYETKLNILYEDEYLLIVSKSAYMEIHPSTSNYETTLSNAVATYLEKQGIYNIHIITRLDKNTTGICIFAKNEYVQELFIRKKDKINLIKNYICIVDGIITNESGIIEKKIARKQNTIILREVNETSGDYAKTEYKVLSRNKDKNYTVVSIILHTGRTHQIRVHMGYIGHFLLGDDLYASEYGIQDICKYISRQALDCHKVSFFHPITNKEIKITSKIPEDMEKLLDF